MSVRMLPPPGAVNLMYDNRAVPETGIDVADSDVTALELEGWKRAEPAPETDEED